MPENPGSITPEGDTWGSRHRQHRSGQPVHVRGLRRCGARGRLPAQHGRVGAWRDNVFIERFWRTIKYEEVYLKAYDTVAQAREQIAAYIERYNHQRPHAAVGRIPPMWAYRAEPLRLAA